MKKITLLIPCYNEESNIAPLYRELTRLAADPAMASYKIEFLMVNDGSTDGTAIEIERLRHDDTRVVNVELARNFGKEAALLAGMDTARDSDAVVILDADLQHPVDKIPEMVKYWEEGYVNVYARRVSRDSDSLLRRFSTRCYYKLLRSMTRLDMPEGQGDFRLLDRRVIGAITSMRESQRYTKGLYNWVGGASKGVEYTPAQRAGGTTSFGFGRLLNLALEGITGFTTTPLKLASYLGFALSTLSLLYIIFILVKYFMYGDPVQGFVTLICVILFLGGVQLLCLGIIGEYLGRTFIESKRRPPYIIDNINGNPTRYNGSNN